jgi:hypothetical protein
MGRKADLANEPKLDWRNVLGITAFVLVATPVALLILSPGSLAALLLAIGMLIDSRNAL